MDSDRDNNDGHGNSRHGVLRVLDLFRNPVPLMAALFVAVLLGLGFLGIVGAPKESLRMEWAKALLDAGVVGIAGALIAYVVDMHGNNIKEQQRQQDAAKEKLVRELEVQRLKLSSQQESLKATLKRITSSYNNCKRARRNMRALALDRSGETVRVDLERYDQFMADLNEAQLELETIIGDIKSDESTYASSFAVLDRLDKMEAYLGNLVGEYEKARSYAGRDATEIAYSKLNELTDFLERKGSRFMSDFADGHRKAGEAIRADLLALTSEKSTLEVVNSALD